MQLISMKRLLPLFLMLFMTHSVLHAEYLENAIPPAKAFDWMELESGEWLKGEFKGIYSGTVEFDSDEFDLVTFELVDIKQIITKGYSTISLNRNIPSITNIYNGIDDESTHVIAGKLSFEGHEFKIILPDGSTRVLQEEDIASISGGKAKESNYWSASIFFGIDFITGNSEQIVVTSKANVQRRTVSTRFMADFLGNYTEVDGNRTTVDSERVNASFDIYQTANFYWRAGSLEYLRDPFKNIRGKYTAYIGIGYDIIYTPKTDWSVTLGPGYQHTTYDDYNTSDPEAIESADTPLFVFDSKFDTELTNDIDFIVNYNMYLVNKESGSYTHHTQVSLKTEFIKDLKLDLSLYWDRTEDPVPFSDGTSPKQDDFTTALSIGYTY